MAEIVFGRVPKPAITRQFVDKPQGAGWSDYGPRDQLVALVYHNVLGNASGTYGYFSTFDRRFSDGGHGWNALTDWGVCNSNDGPAMDGVILQWNDPDGRRSPYASGGTGTPHGDGPAILALCRRLGRNLNQITEAIEISRRKNGDPVSAKCLASVIALSAWRVDAKARVRWDQWPKNAHGLQMTLTHSELGKAECDAGDVVGDVIAGVREVLRRHQEAGEPVPAPAYATPAPPALAVWDGTERELGGATLWACRRRFVAVAETPALRYADRRTPPVRAPLAPGEGFAVDYVLFAAGEWWALTPTGARVPLRTCSPAVSFDRARVA